MKTSRPAVAAFAGKLHEALVTRQMAGPAGSSPRPRAEAEQQMMGTLLKVQDTVKGQPSGALMRELIYMKTDPAWGAEVRIGAEKLFDALKPDFAPIAIDVEIKNGPVALPFKAEIDGRLVDAKLTGNCSDGHLDKARVEVGGKSWNLTDDALSELLNRAGRDWDAENSSQTEVMARSILGFGGVPEAIMFDGSKFREMKKADFDGSPVYYHKGSIALE
jgi:hypothetical protein